MTFSHTSASNPEYYYDGSYMEKLFPRTETDLRKEYWFDENMYMPTNMYPTEIKKFLYVDYYGNNEITSNAVIR